MSTDGVTPIPDILGPSTSVGGVSGGGPDLAAALQALHGAIGALRGALEGAANVGTTGGGGSGCGCGQATTGAGGAGALGAPEAPLAAQSDVPTAPATPAPTPLPPPAPAPAPAAPTGNSTAPAGLTIKNPLPGAKLTSHYGEVSNIRGGRAHSGTDLAKPTGTPILAAAPGTILDVRYDSILGNYVAIDHGNGWVTKYGHMVKKSPLKKGDVVNAGTQIGKVGSTGNSTGPHLHFMVLKNNKKQNPEPFLNGTRTF